MKLRLLAEPDGLDSENGDGGLRLRGRGDAALAERAAGEAIAHELAPITVAEWTAGAALARSDWTGAERHLLEQLELSRAMVNCCTHAALGVVYQELGQSERAESSFLEARRGNPRCESLTVLRSQARI